MKYLNQLIKYISTEFTREKTVFSHQSKLIERLSHELRTALTGIVGYAEFIETNSSQEMVHFTAKIIRESSQDLVRASNSFFDLHLLKQGKFQIKHGVFLFDELARQVIRSYQVNALEKNAHLIYTCADDVLFLEMNSDVLRVKLIVDALVYWAVQMVGKNNSIHVDVSLSESKKYIELMIIFLDLSNEWAEIELHREFWCEDFYSFRLQEGPGVELAFVKELIYFLNGFCDFRFSSTELPRLVVNLPLNT